MGKVFIGLNAEFSRSSDKPFEWAVKADADMGYKFFEPMVHFGRELMSEAGYFHTVSMFDDPWRIKDACDKAGLKISGLQSHGPLGRPDVHGEYNGLGAEALDDSFHTPRRLQETLGLPVLAAIPSVVLPGDLAAQRSRALRRFAFAGAATATVLVVSAAGYWWQGTRSAAAGNAEAVEAPAG